MWKCALLLSFIYIFEFSTGQKALEEVYFNENEVVKLPLGQSANFRRQVWNAKAAKYIEHLYRVCNAKNKKTCGYWENVNTKKKVPSGVTTFNAKNKTLIIKKATEIDEGIYMTGNKKINVTVTMVRYLGLGKK